jgi:hypothetical protein
MSEREDNIETDYKKPILRGTKPKIEKKEVEVKEEQETVIKQVKGKYKLADGTIKEYTYPKKYKKPLKENRGRKPMVYKPKLREMLRGLDDDDCKKIIDFITSLKKPADSN